MVTIIKDKHKEGIYTARHSGGLKECLETELPIAKDTFDKLTSSGIYKYYGYDVRLNADRYILADIDNNIGLPVWINVYEKVRKNYEN